MTQSANQSPQTGHDCPLLPRIGVSSCLLGENVRHDGGDKRNHFLLDILAPHVSFVPVCPEVAIGLSVPREPIRLYRVMNEVRAITLVSGTDLTSRLQDFARQKLADLTDLSGYIFKSRSPSCGLARIPLFAPGRRRREGSSSGIYAATLRQTRSWLPMEEEQHLANESLRDNFFLRVFTLHRFRLALGLDPSGPALRAFHTDHRYLLLAHNAAAWRRLDRLVTEAGLTPASAQLDTYRAEMLAAFAHTASRRGYTRAVRLLFEAVGDRLGVDQRHEFSTFLERYAGGRLALTELRARLLHGVPGRERLDRAAWVCLEPYPAELSVEASAEPQSPAR